LKLSKRIQAVEPSATLAVTARAKAMRTAGIDVLALSAGEPDFDTPDNIKRAAHEAVDAGHSKYTPVGGHPPLRAAVAKKSCETYDQDFASDQVIVCAGGKQVLFNACAAILDPGDQAVFAAPYWVSYPDMVRFAGAEPVPVFGDEAAGFLPKADAYAAAINGRTRLIILNSPQNPTGGLYSRKDLEAIADLLRDHPDVVIITDDIYEGLVYDGDFVSIAHVAPDLYPRMLIASGCSKSYAMTGWRIGYGVGPTELINAMTRLQGASTSGASSIAQSAAVEAVSGDQSALAHMRNVFAQRRDRIVNALRSIPNVNIVAPGGAFYIFPNVSHYIGGKIDSSIALCEYLLETVHLAVVPGSAFGSDAHIRMSFACSEDDIDEGTRRLREGLLSLA
jgi:aspartate aminotransferase